jgi:hypothetical protein
VGNDPRYTKARCFDPFPFPDPDEATRARIRVLGEQLNAHRKRQQALHPGLTLTGMYNVLEKLRAMEKVGTRFTASPISHPAPGKDGDDVEVVPTLTAKEKQIHEQGLVSVLKQIHDDLDAAVFHAYGWDDLAGMRSTASSSSVSDSRDPVKRVPTGADIDEIILQRLVALNHARAEEEKRGIIRWLRPEFQCRDPRRQPVQTEMAADEEEETGTAKSEVRGPKKDGPLAWPKPLAEQVEAVRRALAAEGGPVTAAGVAAQFQRANRERVAEILETLVALGKARQTESGGFQA